MDVGRVLVMGCSVALCFVVVCVVVLRVSDVVLVCVAVFAVSAGAVLACAVVSCTVVGRAPVVSEYLASFLPDRHPPGLFSDGKYSSLSQSS